ncbi:Metallo-beta-lactamase superfamily protein [Duganella sacchari]|uniref:Metallo-beta-lactamase superfamily protein n=1 Tax=Duganella sacchari TaxID=551987 RepID=A0A1M7QJG2_9BURK|nr:MBL fold metallo-hydrolase [Duganella sacchari]SHN31312.1 Metallo-beta-lactamase superfamily protein [Duganella sacchari]
MKKLIATALSIGLMASAQGAAKDLSAEKTIRLANMTRVSEGVYVIEDRQHIMLVPNITIIVGRDAVLVVDTGLGTESAQRVLKAAKKLAGRRKLYLTVTHFHPEHGFGAQVFKGQATIIYNRAQRDEMQQKAPGYQSLFATRLGVAKAMRDVRLVAPDVVYEDAASIDLGGRDILRQVAPRSRRS